MGGKHLRKFQNCFIGVEATIIIVFRYVYRKQDSIPPEMFEKLHYFYFVAFGDFFYFYLFIRLSFLPCTSEKYAKINKYFVNISFDASSILNKHK